ncbi:hypothetical protein AAC387_Pa02g1593 [Persea americana]
MVISLLAITSRPPSASLGLLTSKRSLSFSKTQMRAESLHTSSFISPSISLSFPSSFSARKKAFRKSIYKMDRDMTIYLDFSFAVMGLSLRVDFNCRKVVKDRSRVAQVRAVKYSLCQTKRNRYRKSLARTHGFCRRIRTTGGRAVLKRRSAKGRKVLCTKSNPNSGKIGSE